MSIDYDSEVVPVIPEQIQEDYSELDRLSTLLNKLDSNQRELNDFIHTSLVERYGYTEDDFDSISEDEYEIIDKIFDGKRVNVSDEFKSARLFQSILKKEVGKSKQQEVKEVRSEIKQLDRERLRKQAIGKAKENREALLDSIDFESTLDNGDFRHLSHNIIKRLNDEVDTIESFDFDQENEIENLRYLIALVRDTEYYLNEVSRNETSGDLHSKNRTLEQEYEKMSAEEREQVIEDIIQAVPNLVNAIKANNDIELVKDIFDRDSIVSIPIGIDTLNKMISEEEVRELLQSIGYHAVEIQNYVKEKSSNLKITHTRVQWFEAITEERVMQIVSTTEASELEIDQSAERKSVEEILTRFREATGIEPGRRIDPTEEARDSAFVAEMLKIKEEIGEMSPTDARILNTQLLSLYYLFRGGGIEELFDRYQLKSETTVSPEDESKVKAKLAVDFLRKNAKKNAEKSETDYYSDNDATIGIEVEFSRALENMVNDISVDRDQLKDIDELIRYFEEYDIKANDMKSILHDRNSLAESLARRVGILFSDKTIEEIDSKDLREMLKLVNSQSATQSRNMHDAGFLIDDPATLATDEIITLPAISPRTPMREIELFVKTDALQEANLNIHITVGNVELSPENAEATEIRAIIEATGYNRDISESALINLGGSENIKQVFDYIEEYHEKELTSPFSSETYSKPLELENGTLLLIPYHRVRQPGTLTKYNTTYHPTGFEMRSFNEYFEKPEQATNRIRTVTFVSEAANALKAKQSVDRQTTLGSEGKNSKANAWNEMMSDWQNLLSKYDITPPPNEERFSRVELVDDRFKPLEVNHYKVYLDKIRTLTLLDPDFRSEARKIVREMHKKMRDIKNKKK